jgi:uncharacterized protein
MEMEMALLDQIKADLLAARKRRGDSVDERAIVGVLTSLVGEATAVGKNAGNRISTDEEVLRTVKKFLANAEETKKLVQNSDRQDQLLKTDTEIRVLSAYMPQQMTEGELTEAIAIFVQSEPTANVGQIMAYLKRDFAGQYDGKLASTVAKEVLSHL